MLRNILVSRAFFFSSATKSVDKKLTSPGWLVLPDPLSLVTNPRFGSWNQFNKGKAEMENTHWFWVFSHIKIYNFVWTKKQSRFYSFVCILISVALTLDCYLIYEWVWPWPSPSPGMILTWHGAWQFSKLFPGWF